MCAIYGCWSANVKSIGFWELVADAFAAPLAADFTKPLKSAIPSHFTVLGAHATLVALETL